MKENTSASQDLVTIKQAVALFGVRSLTASALYARIRRGTLYAIYRSGRWYIPRVEIRCLQRQAKQHKQKTTPRLVLNFTAPSNQELTWSVPLAKRGRAALEAQAFLRGTIRARLRRMYPDLSPSEITYKYFQEVARDG